jgi:hypothetical protein
MGSHGRSGRDGRSGLSGPVHAVHFVHPVHLRRYDLYIQIDKIVNHVHAQAVKKPS